MNIATNRRKNVVILGSYNASDIELSLSYELGQHLANLNINVISGGQKGVMYSLCKGIYEHRRDQNNHNCTIVGILPSLDHQKGNEFLDVSIPTGSSLLQNSILPITGDAVIVIGGSAGTLAEISFAWQHKKPIALLGPEGWANKLANQKLDSRRNDRMPHFLLVHEVITWLKAILGKTN